MLWCLTSPQLHYARSVWPGRVTSSPNTHPVTIVVVLIPLDVYCHFPFDVHSKYLQTGLCLISDSLFDILSSLKSDQIGTFSIVTRIWLTFRHLEKTIEPLVRLCSISRGIRMAMPTRLKSKLKSHLRLWMYIKLASNLGGEFTDGDLVVVRLPWWLLMGFAVLRCWPFLIRYCGEEQSVSQCCGDLKAYGVRCL